MEFNPPTTGAEVKIAVNSDPPAQNTYKHDYAAAQAQQLAAAARVLHARHALQLAQQSLEEAVHAQRTADHSANLLRAAGPDAAIAQSCYTDALQCVMAFLSLKDTPHLLCCRAWHQAACSQKAHNRSARVAGSSLVRLLSSPLRSIISTVQLQQWIDVEALSLLCLQMPHLQQLTGGVLSKSVQDILGDADKRAAFVSTGFGNQLRSVSLFFEVATQTSHAQLSINALVSSPALTGISLRFHNSSFGKFVTELSLQPLSVLK
jgi:hypothetical protein